MASDNIDALGMTAEHYAELPDDEQQAAIDTYVATLESEGKSVEEINTALDELKAQMEEIQDLYDGYIEDLDDDEEANAELIAQCQSIIDELGEGEDLVDSAASDYDEHHNSYDSGVSAYVSDLTYDGGTYVYDMDGGDVFWSADGDCQLVTYDPSTGTTTFKVSNPDNPEEYCYVEIKTKTSSNPFESDSTEDDAEYLEEEGVTNSEGEVVTDYNADGYMNQDDIDDALEARDGSVLEDGETQIYFSSGISEDDLETMKATWPTDLLKMCYWGEGSTTSFYDELFGEEDAETNVSVIEGYSDAVSNLSSTTVTQYCDDSLGDLSDEAQAALDALYGYYADPSAADLTEIWSDIYSSWGSLTDEQKATLIQHLVLTIGTSSPDKFAEIFGTQVVALEEMLDYESSSHENYTANDKLIVMLLENLAAPGNLGGTAMWSVAFSPDGTTDGEWADNDENITAITNYKTILTQMGLPLSGSESTALENEEAVNGSTSSGDNGYSESQAEAAAAHVNDYGHTYDAADINEDNYKSYLETAMTEINSMWASGASAQDIQNYLVNYIYGLGGDYQDDVAATITLLIYDYAPDLWDYINTSSFKSDMRDLIYNGWAVPNATNEDRFPIDS